MASTNRPWDLDSALIRPGRFDALVHVPLPHAQERKEILRIHCKGVNVDDDVNFDILAQDTTHFSGAELRALCREAVLESQAQDASSVNSAAFGRVLSTMHPATAENEVMQYQQWQF